MSVQHQLKSQQQAQQLQRLSPMLTSPSSPMQNFPLPTSPLQSLHPLLSPRTHPVFHAQTPRTAMQSCPQSPHAAMQPCPQSPGMVLKSCPQSPRVAMQPCPQKVMQQPHMSPARAPQMNSPRTPRVKYLFSFFPISLKIKIKSNDHSVRHFLTKPLFNNDT